MPSGAGFFKSHATRPIPYQLDENTLRLFISSRDHDDRALPTYIDVELRNPRNILAVCQEPLVPLGEPGTFDDAGVTLVSLIENGVDCYLFYAGLKRRRQTVSWETAIGVLQWNRTTDTFRRVYQGPILAQDKNHPFLTAAPFVMRDGAIYRMWYCSGTGWRFPQGIPEPLYTVYYAESADGFNWTAHAEPVIPYAYDGEVISAPWVMQVHGKYCMWYSTRGHAGKQAKNYTIGYAESSDGISWERLDKLAGISRSQSGWDSEMICYPALHPFGQKMYMFYSGNAVGRDGIGYAITDNFLL